MNEIADRRSDSTDFKASRLRTMKTMPQLRNPGTANGRRGKPEGQKAHLRRTWQGLATHNYHDSHRMGWQRNCFASNVQACWLTRCEACPKGSRPERVSCAPVLHSIGSTNRGHRRACTGVIALYATSPSSSENELKLYIFLDLNSEIVRTGTCDAKASTSECHG